MLCNCQIQYAQDTYTVEAFAVPVHSYCEVGVVSDYA